MFFSWTVLSTLLRASFRWLHRPEFQTRFDGLFQHLFRSRFANASTPSGHARWIDGKAMLKELHAPQVLPVRILYPTAQNVFITEVVHVLEVMQGYHQAGADGRTTLIRTVGGAEQFVQPIPVNGPGKFHQGVTRINDLGKL